MHIKELSLSEFEDFASQSPYDNLYQTLDYALVKAENGYEYEIIGFCDEDDNIHAAATVVVGLINGYIYAYIPRGMIIDYHNEQLLSDFTNAMYQYYKKEGICFIKINPPIPVAELDNKTYEKTVFTENASIVQSLENCGYTKLLDNVYFESVLPRFNPIVELNNYSFDNLLKNTKNKIRKAKRRGLTFEVSDISNINILQDLVKRKVKREKHYYNDYFNIFERSHKADLFLVSIDYHEYMKNAQDTYKNESRINESLNNKVKRRPTPKNVNHKMNSDKALLAYKNDISIASKYLNDNKKYIAAALVIRHGDTATVIISGYDQEYSDYVPNYFLYNEIINYYKDDFKYLDLNGITADFTPTNRYYGLNKFKLGFRPRIYEYIGEFDLIINRHVYNHLYKKGYLYDEFNND